MDPVNPETLRSLKNSQELLHSLMDDCGVKLERLRASREELHDAVNAFRGEYLKLSGTVSDERKQQLKQQLEDAQKEARRFDAEINDLQCKYNEMLEQYMYLTELGAPTDGGTAP